MSLLYKYRHFENPYHLRVLSDGELRFTPPVEFNDPHDCRIPIRWDRSRKKWLASELRKQAELKMPDKDATAREIQVERDLEQMLDPNRQKALLEWQTRKVVSPKVGVLSFSLDSAHPLMWAHYADTHKGFLVGYDQDRLLKAIREISGVDLGARRAPVSPGLEIRPVKVKYPKKMPLLKPKRANEAELVRKIVTTKAREWKYENEVRYLLMKFDDDNRLMHLSKDERIVQFPIDAIKEVTLGVNVAHSNAEQVANILSNVRPHIRLYRATPSFGTYGLDRAEIPY